MARKAAGHVSGVCTARERACGSTATRKGVADPPATAALAGATCAATPAVRYDRPMNDDPEIIEYDDWAWHTGGKFPKRLPLEAGFVHIGLYLAWLVGREFVDPGWVRRAHAGDIVAAIRDRTLTGSALRGVSDGALTSAMLKAAGRDFTTAYYLPEDGYARDYRGVFGRHADYYAVADNWDSYDKLAPLIDVRYDEWQAAGKPDVFPEPRRRPSLLGFLRPRPR
jgi:hypothetical protein